MLNVSLNGDVERGPTGAGSKDGTRLPSGSFGGGEERYFLIARKPGAFSPGIANCQNGRRADTSVDKLPASPMSYFHPLCPHSELF